MKADELFNENEAYLQVSLKSGGIITNFGVKSEKYLYKRHYDQIIERLQEFHDRALEEEPNKQKDNV